VLRESEAPTKLSVVSRPSPVRLYRRWNTGDGTAPGVRQGKSKNLKGSTTSRGSHTAAPPIPSRRRCLAGTLTAAPERTELITAGADLLAWSLLL
jgi:hypothetical protein